MFQAASGGNVAAVDVVRRSWGPVTKPEGEALAETVLITGGAGFIGARGADELLAAGYRVRVLDCPHPQVHEHGRPAYLPDEVQVGVGDVRESEPVERALGRVEPVIHLAARVGVGQSMYEVAAYAGGNTFGTGVLLDAMVARGPRRLVVA